MAKVNVRLKEIFRTPGNVLVTVKSELIDSLAVTAGTNGILPGVSTGRTDGSGLKQFDLEAGRYRIEAQSATVKGLGYSVLIDVDEDELTHEHVDLIVAGAGTFRPVVPPEAANSVKPVANVAAFRALPWRADYSVFFLKEDGNLQFGVYWWDSTITPAMDDGNGILALTAPQQGGAIRIGP